MSRKFSDSSSQELRRDVYNFRFPPLESSGRHWFDPSSLTSSQESRRFSLSRTSGDRNGGFRNSKKVKTIDVDSEPYASCSTQDSLGLDVFEFSDEGFQKSQNLKKADSDRFEYNSSEELGGQKGRESGVFDFSEDVDFQKSKKLKKAIFDPYEYNSSEEVEGIVAPPQRKSREIEIFDFSKDMDFVKSKKLKKTDFYPSEYNSSVDLEGIVAPSQRKSMKVDTFDFSEDVAPSQRKKLKKADFNSYEYISSEELEESVIPLERKSKKIGFFDTLEDVDFQESQTLKTTDLDPYEYISSEELEELVAPPGRKSNEIGVFDFSEDEDLGKPKKSKNAGSNSLVRRSSQKLCDLGILQSRKHGRSELSAELDGVSVKSKKKDREKNGVIEKKKKKKKRVSRESDPGYIELTATLMETQEFGRTTEHIDDVSLALDGLKEGQPVRRRRASLVSLLSICKTLQQRQLLWDHGYLVNLPTLVIVFLTKIYNTAPFKHFLLA